MALEQCSLSVGALSAAGFSPTPRTRPRKCQIWDTAREKAAPALPAIPYPGFDRTIGFIQVNSSRNAGSTWFPAMWALPFFREWEGVFRAWEMASGWVRAQPLIRGVLRGEFLGMLLCHQESHLQILPENPKSPWISGKNLIHQDFLSIPSHFTLLTALFAWGNSGSSSLGDQQGLTGYKGI